MRLWSLHPKYLDTRGLVAVWREGLLAQAVLRGRTSGYRHHPQLERFRSQPAPLGAIAEYLRIVHAESTNRGYSFAGRRISRARSLGSLTVTRVQLQLEWNHLMTKVSTRAPEWQTRLRDIRFPRPHPSFRIVPGGIASWERARVPIGHE